MAETEQGFVEKEVKNWEDCLLEGKERLTNE